MLDESTLSVGSGGVTEMLDAAIRMMVLDYVLGRVAHEALLRAIRVVDLAREAQAVDMVHGDVAETIDDVDSAAVRGPGQAGIEAAVIGPLANGPWLLRGCVPG